MKKLFITAVIFLSANSILSAQLAVNSISNKVTELVINDSLSIKKGDKIQIFLPAGKDFVFVKQKKSNINSKLIGKVAGIVGTGAATVGMSSGNLKVLQGASKVMKGANTVRYGANAIETINELPISNNAKKIAGKSLVVDDWELTNEGYVINGNLDKKTYLVYVKEALISSEIKIP